MKESVQIGESVKTLTQTRRKAGHQEILGETYAKFEFFEHKWNPYSRFLDEDKVDLILRRRFGRDIIYREVQVKYGKLYQCGPKWERVHFDITSWRPFKHDAFDSLAGRSNFFICFVFATEKDDTDEDSGYRGDIFLFPIDDFIRLLESAMVPTARNLLFHDHAMTSPNGIYAAKVALPSSQPKPLQTFLPTAATSSYSIQRRLAQTGKHKLANSTSITEHI